MSDFESYRAGRCARFMWIATIVVGSHGVANAQFGHCLDLGGFVDANQAIIIGDEVDCEAFLSGSASISRDSITVGGGAIGSLLMEDNATGRPTAWADVFSIAETIEAGGSSVSLFNATPNPETVIRADKVYVGVRGAGSLDVHGRSAVKIRTPGTPSSEFVIGRFGGSIGGVLLSGHRAFITVFRTFQIGGGGEGTLRLENGAAASATNLSLATHAGSEGTLVVDGVDPNNPDGPSRMFINPSAKIGERGVGHVLVRNGGLFEAFFVPGASAGGVEIARFGGRSDVRVTGDGSLLSCRALSAYNGIVEIDDGGAVVAGEVVGMGLVDDQRQGNIFVHDGGSLTAQRIWIGLANDMDNSVVIDGIGSRIDVDEDIIIAGTNNASQNAHGMLSIQNNATVTCQTIGVGATESGNDTIGRLDVGSGGMLIADSVTIGCNGVLSGDGGTIVGTVNNDCGQVGPGNSFGELRVEGEYLQTDGVLEIEIGPAGSDLFGVTGNATIRGDIVFTFPPGFVPQPDDVFGVIEVGGLLDVSQASLGFSREDLTGGVMVDETTGLVSFDLPVGNGDFDVDGSVSLIDFRQFNDCVGGEGRIPNPPAPRTADDCLNTFDLDLDGDVDLVDYGRFTTLFSGSR